MKINLTNICFLILAFILFKKVIEKVLSEPIHQTTPVVANLDNLIYKVQNHHDSKEATNMLAEIRKRLCTLINNLQTRYPNDPRTKRVTQRFGKRNCSSNLKTIKHILESEPDPSNDFTSYSLNKGEKVVFCLRSEKNKELHDINIIMFVAIHELAHVMSVTIGHNKEFYTNFRFLLKEAIRDGLYDYENYDKTPKNYCGMDITSTPLEL